MDFFTKSMILEGYYINALTLHNNCILNNFNVPEPTYWLYNESYYRYNYNHLKMTTPKDRFNECLFDYYKFMNDTYPEGFGNMMRLHFHQSKGHINTAINWLDIFFELKAIHDN